MGATAQQEKKQSWEHRKQDRRFLWKREELEEAEVAARDPVVGPDLLGKLEAATSVVLPHYGGGYLERQARKQDACFRFRQIGAVDHCPARRHVADAHGEIHAGRLQRCGEHDALARLSWDLCHSPSP